MADKQGDFIWYELLTSDAAAAQDFYAPVLGWTFVHSGQAGMDYRVFKAEGVNVGGLMQINEDMSVGGARPVWLGYVCVDDVDASVSSICAAGGSVLMPAKDIPREGRIALVSDPQGASFYVMKHVPRVDDPGAAAASFAADEPMVGHCAWNELSTTDPAAATDFYTSQFGWRQEGDMDMGPMGKYLFLWHGAGMIGALMRKMPEIPVSLWTYYFRVPDIDAAVDAIQTRGGRILQAPMEIPGGDYSLNAVDPQGAAFALVGARVVAKKE